MSSLFATRLAPSPTGSLHLGNIRTFLITWALARTQGWRIAMRMEDLDTQRVKPGAAQHVLETLAWLGIDWDGPCLTQSSDLKRYRTAMSALARMGRTYPCELSRAEIEQAASAPHGSEGDLCFPGELRPPLPWPVEFADDATNWRLAVPDETVIFDDMFKGRVMIHPARSIGDFVIWTKRGSPAYQLAVVVDDALQGVTHVIRGDDLLDSAARQLLLIGSLGLHPIPTYCHLPLVVGFDGSRLAKRHGDSRIDTYRQQGTQPESIIGLTAYWCGMMPTRQRLSIREFLSGFRLNTLAREPILFLKEDEQWLVQSTR